jgi:hypothetical protein
LEWLREKWARNKYALFKAAEASAGNSIVSPAEASGESSAVPTGKQQTAPGDSLPSLNHEKTRAKAAGHRSTCYAQRVESCLKVSIADGEYPGVSISAERLGQMLESTGMETDGFPEGVSVPLFHDNFSHKGWPVIYC